MKYYVTYLVMDDKLANPFWHSSVMTSIWHEGDEKIQVTGAWGFYGAPVSAPPSSLIYKIKTALGLRFDFFGNHGQLKKEKMRYLDLGVGLRGVTFEVEWDQYLKLTKICADKIKNHDAAITELTTALSTPNHTPNHAEMFYAEMRLAKEKNRPTRLEPFEIRLNYDVENGFGLGTSHVCKTASYELLKEIGIPEADLEEWVQPKQTFPRTNKVEKIYLHSEGPWLKYPPRNGKTTFYRSWDNKENKLYWSLPPQLLISKWNNPFEIPMDKVEKIKKYISKLQQIEHLIVNASKDKPFEAIGEVTLQKIIKTYTAFAIINRKTSLEKIQQLSNEAKRLLREIQLEPVINYLGYDDQLKINRIIGKSVIHEESKQLSP